jgi:5-hydroxyisourate hydrolase-like protein (transthyretin family)
MILAAMFALLLQSQPAAKASLAGLVVNSATGDPIPNVHVTLARTGTNLGLFSGLVGVERPPGEIVLPGEFLDAIKNAPDISPSEAAAFAAISSDDIDQVILSPAGGPAVVSKSNLPIVTDSQGRFAFVAVNPGTYRLIFSANGFSKQDYGQQAFGADGTPIVLTAGESRREVVMRMTPVGALDGRIRDDMGRPIAGVPVQLLHLSYDESAKKQTKRVASTHTDDRGEYRFYYLSPGRYYLSAGDPASEATPGGATAATGPFGQGYLSANRIPQNYAVTFYPGVSEVSGANAIDVPPGADVDGIDLFLPRQRTFRIRGRVVDSRAGQPPPSAMVTARPQTNDFSTIVSFMSGGRPSYKPDGTFEISNITPGSYMLEAQTMAPVRTPGPELSNMTTAERDAYFKTMQAEQQARPKGSVNVNVANADLDDVVIMIGATSSVSGKLRSGDGTANSGGFKTMRVLLRNTSDAGSAGSPSISDGEVKDDGTFEMKGIAPGEYRLLIAGMPEGSYLKDARLGQSDALNGPLRFPADSDKLDILIGLDAGQIEGIAAQGATVVLIPAVNRSRTQLFRPVTADTNGRFSIRDVIPGDYRLAAWAALEPFAFFDPELLNRADQNGLRIRVTASSKQNVNVTVW